MMHQIIIHDFTYGGRRVAPHTDVTPGYCMVHQMPIHMLYVVVSL